MKLTMKNQYSFQKAMGYCDDPEMMSDEDVAEHITLWQEIVGNIANLNGSTAKRYHDELVQLESFLNELGSCAEIEYEQPLKTYGYHAGFEYYTNFEVIAESQKKADEKALEKFKAMADEMPQQINEAKGCFKYLEQYEPDWGCGDRIYED